MRKKKLNLNYPTETENPPYANWLFGKESFHR